MANKKKQMVLMGQRIKELRADMNQKDLAKKIGVSVAVLSLYENDKAEPSLYTASKLAEALGVSIEYLIKGETEPVEKIIEEKTGLSSETVRILKRIEYKCVRDGLANPIDLLMCKKEFGNAVIELLTASKMLNFDYDGKISEELRELIHELNVINILEGDNCDDYKLIMVELARLHTEDAKSLICKAIDKIRTEEVFKNGKC